MTLPPLLRAALALAAPVLLVVCGRPDGARPAAAVVTAVYALAWLTAARLLLALLLAGLGRLPGPAGQVALRLARRLAPAFLAATVELLAAGAPALATTAPSPPPSLDWPAAAPPAAAPAVPARSYPPRPPARPAAVRVRPGDCLWAIAARHLSPGAPAAEVARAWPAWYAANRAVIGPDPDLVRPGQLLVPPSEEDR